MSVKPDTTVAFAKLRSSSRQQMHESRGEPENYRNRFATTKAKEVCFQDRKFPRKRPEQAPAGSYGCVEFWFGRRVHMRSVNSYTSSPAAFYLDHLQTHTGVLMPAGVSPVRRQQRRWHLALAWRKAQGPGAGTEVSRTSEKEEASARYPGTE